MARDFVTIANMATGFFGEDDQIREPNEDSKPARSIQAVWEEGRKIVLSKGEWDFAMHRAELAALADDAPIGFLYAFPLPVDHRRLVEILEPRELDYSLEGGKILCDTPGPVRIRYVRDVPEPALWSDGFVEAFSMWLAWRVADRLSGDKQRKREAWAAYKEALKEAKGVDAKQNPPRQHPETEWTRARHAGVSDLSSGRH